MKNLATLVSLIVFALAGSSAAQVLGTNPFGPNPIQPNPCPANPISVTPAAALFDWNMSWNPVDPFINPSIPYPLLPHSLPGNGATQPGNWITGYPPTSLYYVSGLIDGAEISLDASGDTLLKLQFQFYSWVESSQSNSKIQYSPGFPPAPVAGTGIGPNPISLNARANNWPSVFTIFGAPTPPSLVGVSGPAGASFCGQIGAINGQLPFNFQITLLPNAWQNYGQIPITQDDPGVASVDITFPGPCLWALLDGLSWTFQSIVNYPDATGAYGISVLSPVNSSL